MRVVVALSSQPEGQGLWHVRGRQFRASALAPSSPGTAALGSAGALSLCVLRILY